LKGSNYLNVVHLDRRPSGFSSTSSHAFSVLRCRSAQRIAPDLHRTACTCAARGRRGAGYVPPARFVAARAPCVRFDPLFSFLRRALVRPEGRRRLAGYGATPVEFSPAVAPFPAAVITSFVRRQPFPFRLRQWRQRVLTLRPVGQFTIGRILQGVKLTYMAYFHMADRVRLLATLRRKCFCAPTWRGPASTNTWLGLHLSVVSDRVHIAAAISRF